MLGKIEKLQKNAGCELKLLIANFTQKIVVGHANSGGNVEKPPKVSQ